MMRWMFSRLRLSVASRILLPLLVLLAWLPGFGAATAATASIGISVQVCTTAPQCSPDNNSEWASTTAVQSGATVVWRVSITNTGGVALTSIVTNDAGNADCAGSVTAGPLQPGQVTAYTCHSDNVTQATTNTASATGTPPSGPNVTSATSSASVTISSGTTDPNAGISALVQVCILAVLTSCDPGNAADWAASATVYTSIIRWRVVITNTGTDTLTGITAATSLPRSESDCGGSVPPGTLNAGGVIDYECETDNVTPPSTFTQTVTASGQPPTGPVITSAGSTATAQVAADNPPPGSGISAQLQICVLSNLAACDPTNAADWASSATLSSTTARWRVVVTNTGTLALSSIYASDTLAQTDCGGFVASSLAPGATTQYSCQTDNVTQTTTNSLTVTGNTPPSGVPITSAASTATAVVGVVNGGIGFVQGTAFGTGTRVTSLTVTLGGPVGAGDLLVGWVAEYNAAGNVTVSDSINGAWTRSAAAETFGNGTGDIALFYLPDSKASSSGATITITAPAGAYLQGSIAEYSGLATSTPLDQAQVAKGNGTTVTAGPTSSVPAGELVYSALLTGGNPGAVSPGSSQGVTYAERAATSSGSAYEQDILAAAAGAQTTTATLGTATDWYAVVATFRP